MINKQTILNILKGNPLHLEALARRMGITETGGSEYKKLRNLVSEMQTVSSQQPTPMLKHAVAKYNEETVYPIYLASEENKLFKEGRLSEEFEVDLAATAQENGLTLTESLNLIGNRGRDRK